MSNALTDDVFSQLQGAPLQQMGQRLGIGPAQMAGAVSAALPLLLGALGRNTSEPQGAQSLFGALQNDHAGSDLGSVLGSVLGGQGGQTRQLDGGKILGHIFGGRQPRAEAGLGEATGLGNERAGQLMRMLAPIVLAYLAKRMFDNRQANETSVAGAPAQPNPQVLGDILGEEQRRVSQQGGVGGGLLGAVLDQDGDGQLGLGDLLKMGGGLFGGKR